MKIGVLSDSHKNIPYLRRAIEALIKEGVSILIHLGDDYADSKILDEYPIKNIKVPGVFDPEYKEKDIENRVLEKIHGMSFLISHTKTSHRNDQKEDIIPEDIVEKGGVDIFLFGHSHLYEIKKEGKTIFFNPGHLQEVDAKGRKASYGIIDINGRIVCSIHNLDGNCILKDSFEA